MQRGDRSRERAPTAGAASPGHTGGLAAGSASSPEVPQTDRRVRLSPPQPRATCSRKALVGGTQAHPTARPTPTTASGALRAASCVLEAPRPAPSLHPRGSCPQAGSRCTCHVSPKAEWTQGDILSTWLTPQALRPPGLVSGKAEAPGPAHPHPADRAGETEVPQTSGSQTSGSRCWLHRAGQGRRALGAVLV